MLWFTSARGGGGGGDFLSLSLSLSLSLFQLLDALDRRGPREGGLYLVLHRQKEAILKHMPAKPIGWETRPVL